MKIIYMGTPEFAVAPLERLYSDGHEIVGVFTQPDKPKSRGMKMTYSPVKKLAIMHNTPVFQPLSLKDGEALNILNNLVFDLIVVVAYGKILPAEILSAAPMGAINIHASLLPKYRGAAPIQWAILNGETETGVTSMYMAEELDAGDIIFSKKTKIDEDETAGELMDRLSHLGAKLLSETVFAIADGSSKRAVQDHANATFAPLLSRELSPIDWNDTALNIKNKVRGLSPWPGATSKLRETLYKIISIDIFKNTVSNALPGEIVSTGQHGIEIACADGTVTITQLQAPGGKRMSAQEHLKGNPF